MKIICKMTELNNKLDKIMADIALIKSKLAIENESDNENKSESINNAESEVSDNIKSFIEKYKDESIMQTFNSAIFYGHLDVVKYLYKKYTVDITHNDHSALRKAVKNNQLDIIKYFIEDLNADKSVALFSSARSLNCVDVLKYMIEATDNLDTYCRIKVLHEAILGNNLEGVKYLIEQYGKYFFSKHKALNLAFNNKHFEIVKYLFELGE